MIRDRNDPERQPERPDPGEPQTGDDVPRPQRPDPGESETRDLPRPERPDPAEYDTKGDPQMGERLDDTLREGRNRD
jgi:hypothetical protein